MIFCMYVLVSTHSLHSRISSATSFSAAAKILALSEKANMHEENMQKFVYLSISFKNILRYM